MCHVDEKVRLKRNRGFDVGSIPLTGMECNLLSHASRIHDPLFGVSDIPRAADPESAGHGFAAIAAEYEWKKGQPVSGFGKGEDPRHAPFTEICTTAGP
jgi:hypothetical protein